MLFSSLIEMAEHEAKRLAPQAAAPPTDRQGVGGRREPGRRRARAKRRPVQREETLVVDEGDGSQKARTWRVITTRTIRLKPALKRRSSSRRARGSAPREKTGRIDVQYHGGTQIQYQRFLRRVEQISTDCFNSRLASWVEAAGRLPDKKKDGAEDRLAMQFAEQHHNCAGSAPQCKKRLSTEAEDALTQWLAQVTMTCRHRQRGCWATGGLTMSFLSLPKPPLPLRGGVYPSPSSLPWTWTEGLAIGWRVLFPYLGFCLEGSYSLGLKGPGSAPRPGRFPQLRPGGSPSCAPWVPPA